MLARECATTVLIGPFGPTEGSIFRSAVARANADAVLSPSVRASQDRLSALQPKCIFVDGDGPELAATTAWIRERPRLFSTQVVALVSELRDSSFVQSYRDGADDVIVRSNVGGVTRRIANLQHFDPAARPPIARGRALISHEVDEQRRRLGRVLRQAGFDVHFAFDTDEIAAAMGSEPAPELVVVSNQILPVQGIRRVRREANAARTPFVLVATTWSTRITLDPRVERVATISERAPHDHLLFIANDLLRDGARTARGSTRYLFDTICSFRSGGVFSPEYGLTYNLSESGIYVRTLDPPSENECLWLELRPPGTTETVHLRGTLVRVATPGKGAQGTPPGFGLRIDVDASPARDLEVYRRAFRILAQVPNQLALSWLP